MTIHKNCNLCFAISLGFSHKQCYNILYRIYSKTLKIRLNGGIILKQAIIFDLDGTLTDTVGSIAEAGNAMLTLRGWQAQAVDAYRYFAGDGAKALVLRALIAAGDSNAEQSLPEALAQYMEIFAETCTHGVKPFDGIPELLTQLKERGVRIAVLSNKPHPMTVDVVHSFFGESLFDVVQGQTADIPPKPDQTGVQHILAQLLKGVLGVIAQGLDMGIGSTGTDQEVVGKAADPIDLQELDIHALFGIQSLGYLIGDFFRC